MMAKINVFWKKIKQSSLISMYSEVNHFITQHLLHYFSILVPFVKYF